MRAAAGADLHHLDHRDPQRQPGSFAEPPDAGDLERAGGLRLAVIDQADLRRGAAHVERQHAVEPAFAARCGAEKIAPPAGPLSTSRIGKRHAVSIVVSPPPDSIRNTGAATPSRAQPVLQPRADSAPSSAARRRWRRWWKSAPIRASPATPRDDSDTGMSGSASARMSRARRSCAGLTKACRNPTATLSTPSPRSTGTSARTAASSSGSSTLPVVVQPLRHRQAQVARHQRLRQHDVQVVLVVTAFVAHRDHVAKSFGGEQRGAGALALDHRVGRQRGAVDHDADVGCRDAGGRAASARTPSITPCSGAAGVVSTLTVNRRAPAPARDR